LVSWNFHEGVGEGGGEVIAFQGLTDLPLFISVLELSQFYCILKAAKVKIIEQY